MEWDINNLDEIVKYINKELENRTMIDIENNVFGANERVIHKRLLRKGYKRIDNRYIKGIQKYNESITKNNNEYTKSITKVIPVKKEHNSINDMDIKSIKELITLIDPIKEVIQKCNKCITNENIINVDLIEININRDILKNKVIPVGFKVDEEVYKDWKKFTKNLKDIKNQDLLGMALIEYMKKYNI